MKKTIRMMLSLVLCLCMLPGLIPAAGAQEEQSDERMAQDISSRNIVTASAGFPNVYGLFDKNRTPLVNIARQSSLTLSHPEGIGSLYLVFQDAYGAYTLTNNDTGAVVTCGEAGFLHEFIDVEALFGTAPETVTVSFDNGQVKLAELSVYTPGEVPDSVQKWNTPAEGETDLLLYSTHGDDEHLFFAGILPYYAAELGYQVQVVYMTDHWNDKAIRVHEMLDGLWAVGCRNYPVMGKYYDFREGSLDITYRAYERLGTPREQMLGFIVEQMRRFKPKVVVTHDFNGEYGHGMHMAMADMVAETLEISSDPQQYPELAEKYGVWDAPKAYFHLYEENQIVMDWDRPLESFNGETAFEVSIWRGFQCHKSQIRDFAWYYAGFPDAKSLPKYNPCYFGLYRSTVGADAQKDDFFENVTTYAQDREAEAARLQAEEEARLKAEEEARKQAEEEARRQAEEEARKKAEEERLAREKAEAEARAAQEQQLAQERKQKLYLAAAGTALVLVIFLLIMGRKARRKKV